MYNSANQLLYLTVYSGECSEGEFPGYSTADLLKCGTRFKQSDEIDAGQG